MTESDFRKIGVAGIVFLVIVRLAIGWQMLYEGLWKIKSQGTAKPWTAEPYLKNATGPLRSYFRNMTGDPDDLHDLDYDTISKRWATWGDRFAAHYGLTDQQKSSLNNMLHGPERFARNLEQLPPGVNLDKKPGRGIYYDAAKQQLVVDGKLHMTPREKQEALAQVNFVEGQDNVNDLQDPVVKKYVEEVLRIYQQQSRLSYLEQAMATLKGNPEMAGSTDEAQKGTNDEHRLGKIEIYRNRLKRYEENLANAETHFDQEHLDYDWREIQKLRAELVGPIRGLENDLKWKADKLLSTNQLSRGPLPEEKTPQRDIDLKTMWGLTIIGVLLIAGCLTRVAALAGAFLIFQFYISYPPFPGYPHPPGPEHSLFVNKNLVEVLILLTLVFLPTGRWFGIDAIFAGWWDAKKKPNDKK